MQMTEATDVARAGDADAEARRSDTLLPLAASDAAAPFRPSPQIWLLALLCFLGWTATSLTYPVLPDLILREQCERLGIAAGGSCNESEAAQAAQARFAAVYSLLTGVPCVLVVSLYSHLSDVVGRKKLLYLSCIQGIAFGGLITVFGLTKTWVLVLITCLNAVGDIFISTGVIFAAVSDLTEASTLQERARILGLVESGCWAGQIVGPVLGGAVATSYGLRWALALGQLLSLGCLGVVAVGLQETLPAGSRSPFMLSKVHPLGSLSVLENPRCWVLAGGMFALQWSITGGCAAWPMFCKSQYDWTDRQVGDLQSLFFLANTIGLFLVLPFFLKVMSNKTIALFATGCAVVFWAGHMLIRHGWTLYLLVLLGMFIAMMYPMVRAGIVDKVPPERHGAALGVVALMERAGVSCALPATSAEWHWIEGSNGAVNVHMAFLIACLQAGLAFFLVLLMPSTARSVHSRRGESHTTS